MEEEKIDIPIVKYIPVLLKWSHWVLWKDVEVKEIPNDPGVYEVKFSCSEKRLHIGCSGIGNQQRLRGRIEKMLKGKDHPAGENMKKENIDFSNVVIRWASIDKPRDVEKELHRRHQIRFVKLPQYDKQV